MSGVNPDVVDSEVGNIWRQLYKLEKGFENVPAAKKIATKVLMFPVVGVVAFRGHKQTFR